MAHSEIAGYAVSFPKSGSVVGVNFTQSSVRLAYAKMVLGKIEITAIKSLNTAGMDDMQIAFLIRDTLKSFRIKKPLILINIDSPAVITKNIEIPSIDDKEIHEIIDLQAGRYTPYAREEIVVEHINVDTYHESYTKVFIVIVMQNVVKRCLGILSTAGLGVDKIQLSAEGISAVVNKMNKLSTKAAPTALLNVDTKSSDFIVVFKGRTIFLRCIPLGAEHFVADREGFAAGFNEELVKTLEAYRSEDIEGMPDELLCIAEDDLVSAVRQEFMKVNTLSFLKIPFYESITIPREMLVEARHLAFSSVLASVMTPSDSRIDLRPSEFKLKVAFRQRSVEIIKSGMFVVAIIVMLAVLLLIKIYYRGLYLNRVDTQINALGSKVANLEKILTRNTVIKSFLLNRPNALEPIVRLYEVVPEDMYLKA